MANEEKVTNGLRFCVRCVCVDCEFEHGDLNFDFVVAFFFFRYYGAIRVVQWSCREVLLSKGSRRPVSRMLNMLLRTCPGNSDALGIVTPYEQMSDIELTSFGLCETSFYLAARCSICCFDFSP